MRSIASSRMILVWSDRMARKSRLSVACAISPRAPASSTPVGPPPTRTNRHPGATQLRIGLALGGLERDQDPPPDLEGVLDRLEPGRDARPLRVVEVGVMGAGRDHERVVRDRATVGQQDLPCLGIDPDRLAEDDRRVALLAQHRAQRLGDVARRQGAGRDLVEQRLEEMEIAPVDEREAHLRDRSRGSAPRTARQTRRPRRRPDAEDAWPRWRDPCPDSSEATRPSVR